MQQRHRALHLRLNRLAAGIGKRDLAEVVVAAGERRRWQRADKSDRELYAVPSHVDLPGVGPEMRLSSDAADPKRSREREWRQGDTGYRTIQLRISHSAAPPRHVRQSPGNNFIAYQTAQRLFGSKLFVRIVALGAVHCCGFSCSWRMPLHPL